MKIAKVRNDEKDRLSVAYPRSDSMLTNDRDLLFSHWRKCGPIIWAEEIMGIGAWMVLSHQGCRAIAQEHSSLTRKFMLDPKLASADDPPNRRFQQSALFFSEDPDHARIRGLFRGLITQEMIASLPEKIEGFCRRVLPTLQKQGEIDVVHDFVYPLCWMVNDLIGIEKSDVWRFTAWQAERPNSRHLRIVPYGVLMPMHARSMSEQMDVMHRTVSHRRRNPADDLITKLVQRKDAGYEVTDEEIALNAQFLGMATFDALRDQLSGSILALLQHPSEIKELAQDPRIISNALEELLRFVTPDQLLRRMTTQDWEIHGVNIPANELVIGVLGAANRDPEIFADPNRLWLRRPNASANIAFGVGAFSCIAFRIAKVMLSEMLKNIIAYLPYWKVDAVSWLDQPQIRSLRRFIVKVDHSRECA